MTALEYLCLDCGAGFAVQSDEASPSGVRCASCASLHVRQTFASYLRYALQVGPSRTLDELRCEHFG